MSIDQAVAEFAHEVQSHSDPWAIFWCAGIGTYGADIPILDDEFSQVEYFLECLTSRISSALQRGTLFYSSSAGALYGGSLEEFITEESELATNSPYGEMKLRVEKLVEGWSNSSGCRVAIGRISNLYGSGQNLSKRQGFITTACLDLLCHRPLDIFVPLDTIRNYIYVADAAKTITLFVNKVSRFPAARVERKLICSNHNLSIASILQMLGHVFGRKPPVSLSRRSTSTLYVRSLSMSSTCHLDTEPESFVLPEVGIAEVRRQLLLRLMTATVFEQSLTSGAAKI